ncbi:cta [Cordylochernes scorpioides]|uniref:Cta n=1 Tax=Cordylochernes scorpioides TaxID=51811 RepID=A0ABY6K7F7_9ARAC|nr:cta [Cordylochernes scorpioides]
MIEKDKHAIRRQVKLLLLGAGESGKSTFLKQMRIIHGHIFDEETVKEYRNIIYQNIVKGMKVLVDARDKLNIPWEDPINSQHSNLILNYENNMLLDTHLFLMFAPSILHLWNDKGIKTAFDRRREFQLRRGCKSQKVYYGEWFTTVTEAQFNAGPVQEGLGLSSPRAHAGHHLPRKKPLLTWRTDADLKEEWRNRWSNLAIANKDLVEDPNTKPPGYNLPRRTWSTLNRIRTSTGRCNYLLNKWNMSPDQNCDCGQIQTMHHILRDCPRRFFQGTLGDIHRCTEEALEWILKEWDHIHQLASTSLDLVAELIDKKGDSVRYFFDHLDRIAIQDYIPSNQDILHARKATKGITEFTVPINNIPFRFVDVGGQRSQRQKWFQCFDSVTSILFLVSTSEFDQVLLEDRRTNRLLESAAIFETIVNNRCFTEVSIILFLNKCDLLTEKVNSRSTDISRYFDNFQGDPHHLPDVQAFIYNLFDQSRRDRKKKLFHHFTTAVDTENIKVVFNAVRDTILERNITQIMLQ